MPRDCNTTPSRAMEKTLGRSQKLQEDLTEALEDLVRVCDDALKDRTLLILAGNPALENARRLLEGRE